MKLIDNLGFPSPRSRHNILSFCPSDTDRVCKYHSIYELLISMHMQTEKAGQIELGATWLHGIKGHPAYEIAVKQGLIKASDKQKASESPAPIMSVKSKPECVKSCTLSWLGSKASCSLRDCSGSPVHLCVKLKVRFSSIVIDTDTINVQKINGVWPHLCGRAW